MNPKFIIGYTDTETVKLDLDDVPFKKAKYLALRTMKWFGLKGFIIPKPSKKCYHVIFDKRVSWKDNMKIVSGSAFDPTIRD